jgi:HK97 family phage prohead protease
MEYKSLQIKDADVNLEQRIIRAYASTFDLDQGNDIIHPGSFKKTISERLDRVKVLRNHSDLIGRPISAIEDGKGLLTESYIGKHDLGEETLMLAKDGILDSLSIGYSVPSGKSNYSGDIRNIHEVKLFEWSVVDFPMNEAARIIDVKSIETAIKNGTLNQKELKSLVDMLGDLTALLKDEPSSDTLTIEQPQDLNELKDLIKNWGKSAQ